MRKFRTTLLTAVAGIVSTAAVALPAIGDSGKHATGKSPDVSDFAACLVAHGLPGAPSNGVELKQWLAGKESQDPRAVDTAMEACKRSRPEGGTPGPDVARTIACLRGHGIDAPTAPEDFKRWIGERQTADGSKALDNALIACKMTLATQNTANDAAKPNCNPPTDKPPAAKPETSGNTNGT
jgi:hypothetical protein